MKKVLVVSSILVFIAFVLLFLLFRKSPIKITTILKTSPSPSTTQQEPFRVVGVEPKDKAEGVYPGEIDISFTTDKDIISESSFSLDIQPKLPFYWKLINSYPTKKVVAKVFGRLDPSTQYFLTVKDAGNDTLLKWSFSTSSQRVESSSAYIADYEKRLDDQYYPLSTFIPFENGDFKVGYKDRLTLNVFIKKPDIELVKKEVDAWIRSHNVDPATHTLIYINRF